MVNHLLETRHPLSSSAVRLCVSVCDPSSILRTHFQVPYPASPLLACPPWRATLTKTPGGMGVFFPFWNSPAIQFASRMELRDLFLSLRLSRRSDVQTFRHLYLPVVIK